jgi:hypothetical protein
VWCEVIEVSVRADHPSNPASRRKEQASYTHNMAVKPALLALWCFADVGEAKGPCEDYFGPMDSAGNLTTVVDPDVTEGFPFAYSTFVHHSGPGSVCFSPGPPKGCHRYYVVQYRNCDLPCPLADGSASKYAGARDDDGRFDRANGILRACAACATSVEIQCFHAPASEPVRCACPGAPAASPSSLLVGVQRAASHADMSPIVVVVGVLGAAMGYAVAGRTRRT